MGRLRLYALLAMLTATGAAALIYQLVWARRMTLVVGATSRAAALVFATFMLGTAIGAALAQLGRAQELRTQG